VAGQRVHGTIQARPVLADEVARRDTNSAALRARAAGLGPGMRLDTWDTAAAVHCSLGG
jgi:hypothetical protein